MTFVSSAKNRIAVLIVLICAVLIGSQKSHAQSPQHKLRIGHISTLFDYAPVWMAVKKGYFSDEGIDASYTVTGSVPKTAEGLKDGTFDISITVPESIIANVESGGNMRLIAGITGKVAASLITAPSIKQVADLKGKRLGVSGLKEGTGLLMLEMVKQHGLQASDVELKVVGVGGDRWRALQASEIEAGIQNAPLNFMAMEKGFNNLGDAPDVLPPYQFIVIAARQDWLEQNPEVAVKALRAILRGLRQVYSDKQTAIELAVENMKVTPEMAARTWDFYVKHKPHDMNLEVTPVSFRKTLDTMVGAGTLSKESANKPERFVDSRFLQAARLQLGL
jgi:ABC-type nitrate/sulfonate/bicarbonate transport system substrate-binding protein